MAASRSSARDATLGELHAEALAALGATPSPRLEADLLVGFAAGVTRSTIAAFPERTVDAAAVERFRAALARRAAGEPLAYITGTKEFYSLTLAVTSAVLIPRPETELLVDAALAHLPPEEPRAVLDVGTGSGAVALAIKHERPKAAVTALDESPAALDVARANGARLGLAVRWLQSDWFDGVPAERFDVIVSNPPYVCAGDPALGTALRFEPRAALDGGPDGLAAYRRLLAGAAAHLSAGGTLLLEHGSGQRAPLERLGAAFGWRTLRAHEDLGGHDRVLELVPG
jgi:release factor glutamine methyltransferase